MKRTITLILIFTLAFFGLSYFGWKSFEKKADIQRTETYNQNVREKINQLLVDRQIPEVGQGDALVLNVWATWCGPCIGEISELNLIAKEYKDAPVRFLAFSNETMQVWEVFQNRRPEFRFDYELLFEADEIISFLSSLDLENNGHSIPIHLLINSDGTLEKVITGASEATILQIRSFLEPINQKTASIE